MKKLNFIIILLIACTIHAQNTDNNKQLMGLFDLKRAPDLTYQNLLSLKLNELSSYADGFSMQNELEKGKYSVEETKNEIIVTFGATIINTQVKGNTVKNVKGKQSLRFRKKILEENGVSFNSLEEENESDFVNYDKAEKNVRNSINGNNSQSFPTFSYVWDPKIIIDKEIVNFGSSYNYGKILNRSVTTANLITLDFQPCQMFAHVTDGAIASFPNNGYTSTKVFVADDMWNRVTWFDEDASSPYSRSFGTSGSGYNQFNNPSGLTVSGPYNHNNGGYYYYDYPIYVADYGNKRIVKFTYDVTHVTFPNSAWYYQIIDGSFSVVKNCQSMPYDIEIHKGMNGGTDLSAMNDDVIWFTEDFKPGYDLIASNAVTGSPLNEINNFIFQGATYRLNPSRISVYRSVDGAQNILACIDNSLKAAIFFRLNPDGTMFGGNIPTAYSLVQFGPSYQLSSIKLVNTNPALGLQAFVSSNDASLNGFINVLKVNILNGYPIAEYLASYGAGFNSNIAFKLFNNLGNQNGFDELFTLENWDNNYGIRRYREGMDIIAESNTGYCGQGLGITFTYRVSEPDRITLSTPKYSPDNGQSWVDASYSTISGGISADGTYYLPAGTSNLHIVIQTPSNSSPSPPTLVKFEIWHNPQDVDPVYDADHTIKRQYQFQISNCNSGGGCPYVYVFDGDSLRQDNNILHRSEFSTYSGLDITDQYKLNIAPYLDPNNNSYKMEIRELDNDHSYFDRFQLKAIDHPVGTEVAVTENNDIVLYFPQMVIDPTTGTINDSNVTCSLAYDTSCSSVPGDSSAVVTTTVGTGGKAKLSKSVAKILSTLRFTLGKVLEIKKEMANKKQDIATKKKDIVNKKNVKTLPRNDDILDSMAVIFDPERDHITPVSTNKTYAGSLIAYDNASLFNSGAILFARRENRSVVSVPVGEDFNIDSVSATWYRDFNISFFCTTPVYYEGYLETDIPLSSAINSVTGDMTRYLLQKDSKYAEMDNTQTIDLSFANVADSIPVGWTRDFILVTDGRYIYNKSSKPTLNNVTNTNLPKVFRLYQNYPNPFNPTSVIKYDLPKDVKVTIKIYDILGRDVKTLINEVKQAGYYDVTFDGFNYASGVYFYRIEAGTFVQSKKMVLIK